MTYLLDTNVFIAASKQWYAKEIVPSFWNFLERDVDIFTIDDVMQEIKRGNDEVPGLIKSVKIYANQDEDNLDQHINKVSDYLEQEYRAKSPENLNKFMEGADFLLVCTAKANDLTIVTHEESKKGSLHQIAIPDVCEKFGVHCMDTFAMLKAKNINLSDYS